MSPEQVRGEAVDPRSDIFSFGLVLYECLSGRPPFERPTGVEVMTAILREDPPELPETVAPALRQIVAHCLEKEPDAALPFGARPGLCAAHRQHLVRPVPAAAAKAAIVAGRNVGARWLWPAVACGAALLLASLAIPHYLGTRPHRSRGLPFHPVCQRPRAGSRRRLEPRRQEHRLSENHRRHPAAHGARARIRHRHPADQIAESPSRTPSGRPIPPSSTASPATAAGELLGYQPVRRPRQRTPARTCATRQSRPTARRSPSGAPRNRVAQVKSSRLDLLAAGRGAAALPARAVRNPTRIRRATACTFRRTESPSC